MRHGLLAEAADLAARWHAVVGSLPAAERPTKQVTARMALLRFVARAQSGEPGETLRLGRALIAEHKDELDRDARVTLDLRLGQTLVLLGQPEKARVRLRRVHEGAEAPRARADAARWLVRSHLYSRELDEATRWLAEAIALAGDGRAAKARVEVLRGELLAARGDLEAARELFLPLRELARAERRAPLVGNVAVSLGHVLTKLERFDEARALFEEGMGAFRSAGRVRAEAVATLGFAETFLWQGRVEDARAPLEHGLAVCQSIGDALGTAEGLVHLGAAGAWSQDPAAGAAMCEQGCKRALEAGLREAEVVAELHLLRTALLRHDAAAVATALRRCSVQRRHLTGPLFTRRLTELEAQAAELGVKLSTPPLGDS
jgi:tetratricopeptide (TPR) repeat protein